MTKLGAPYPCAMILKPAPSPGRISAPSNLGSVSRLVTKLDQYPESTGARSAILWAGIKIICPEIGKFDAQKSGPGTEINDLEHFEGGGGLRLSSLSTSRRVTKAGEQARDTQ